jgi:hypothetical protein
MRRNTSKTTYVLQSAGWWHKETRHWTLSRCLVTRMRLPDDRVGATRNHTLTCCPPSMAHVGTVVHRRPAHVPKHALACHRNEGDLRVVQGCGGRAIESEVATTVANQPHEGATNEAIVRSRVINDHQQACTAPCSASASCTCAAGTLCPKTRAGCPSPAACANGRPWHAPCPCHHPRRSP